MSHKEQRNYRAASAGLVSEPFDFRGQRDFSLSVVQGDMPVVGSPTLQVVWSNSQYGPWNAFSTPINVAAPGAVSVDNVEPVGWLAVIPGTLPSGECSFHLRWISRKGD